MKARGRFCRLIFNIKILKNDLKCNQQCENKNKIIYEAKA